MSAAKKIIRRELDRLKKALDKVIKPGKESLQQQWALQPVRTRENNRQSTFAKASVDK